jgi:hypothetical protein
MQHLHTPVATSPNNDCNITELRPPGCRDLLAAAKEPRRWRAAAARHARSRPWRAAVGACPPSSQREPPSREDGSGRRRVGPGSGRKGGESAERGPRRRGARESHNGEAVGRPRPRRAASAAGARSPRTHHGRRRNQEELKGGATEITDQGSVRAEMTRGGRSSGGGGGQGSGEGRAARYWCGGCDFFLFSRESRMPASERICPGVRTRRTEPFP